MTQEFHSNEPDEITRRRWLMRFGGMAILAGISGVVPESFVSQVDAQQNDAADLPPGLYRPSADHLVHALQSAGKSYSPPAGSETEYAQPPSNPFQPQFFSPEEFRVATRLVEIVLGKVEATVIVQTTQWLDLWFQSAAGVLEAAQHLDPLHRTLAVAYYGEQSVRELETTNPQAIARAGFPALLKLSEDRQGRGFLELTEAQRLDLIVSVAAAEPDTPVRIFLRLIREAAIRGYYTSAEGLKDLDFKGNAYYPECPGCAAVPVE